MEADSASSLDRLALVDLDGTLIDGSYEVTDQNIYEAIAATQATGWHIGLSSDTPYEALRIWRERFGMIGPIIAEKGAIVEIDGQPEIDTETVQAFSEVRLSASLMFEQHGFRVWSGNPVEAFRIGLRIGEADERVVLLNATSQVSLRFFVRRVNASGELVIDNAVTEELAAQAREQYPNFDDIIEEINPAYGLVIVSRGNYTKRIGTKRLMSAGGLQRIVMIGNSTSDYVGSDIAWHGAVGDAMAEFMGEADYVADARTTSGVIEILGRLAS